MATETPVGGGLCQTAASDLKLAVVSGIFLGATNLWLVEAGLCACSYTSTAKMVEACTRVWPFEMASRIPARLLASGNGQPSSS